MNIKALHLNNIISFDKLKLDFSQGINIIDQKNININSKILKIIYAMYSNDTHIGKCNFDLAYTYFKVNAIKLINDNINVIYNKPTIKVIYEDDSYFTYDLLKYEGIKAEISGVDKYYENNHYKIIFIPSDDILYNSQKIEEFNEKYTSSFDRTYVDIIKKVKRNKDKDINFNYKEVLNLISKTIDGIPIYEDKEFYILKKDNYKVNLSTQSKENRKFALLYMLIKNEFINNDIILIWDRPTKYLSEKYITILNKILKNFERLGIQIIISV